MAFTWTHRMKSYDGVSPTSPHTSADTFVNEAGSLLLIGTRIYDAGGVRTIASLSSPAFTADAIQIASADNGSDRKSQLFWARASGVTGAITSTWSGAATTIVYLVTEIKDPGYILGLVGSNYHSSYSTLGSGNTLTLNLPNSVKAGSETYFAKVGTGTLNTPAGWTELHVNSTGVGTKVDYEPTPTGTSQWSASVVTVLNTGLFLAEIGRISLKPRLVSVTQN